MITITNKDAQSAEADLALVLDSKNSVTKSDLPHYFSTDIENILSDGAFVRNIDKLSDVEFRRNLNSGQFAELFDSLESIYHNLKSIKTNLDVEMFIKEGYKLDE